MAFKDEWKDKTNNVDDVLAEDINLIAQEVIRINEELGDSGSDAEITVDSALSSESENPVQNKVITGKLTNLENGINLTNANVGNNTMRLVGFEFVSGSVKAYIDESIQAAILDSWEAAV